MIRENKRIIITIENEEVEANFKGLFSIVQLCEIFGSVIGGAIAFKHPTEDFAKFKATETACSDVAECIRKSAKKNKEATK